MTKLKLLNSMYFLREWKYLFYITFILFLLQGFGGKFGVQSDRMDKSAHKFEEKQESIGTNYQRTKPDIQGSVCRPFSVEDITDSHYGLICIVILFLYIHLRIHWNLHEYHLVNERKIGINAYILINQCFPPFLQLQRRPLT